jgi:hypothetical protein
MSRLTNDIRNQMARKLVNHRYTDEAKAILYNDRKLADEAYNLCYPKALLEHMEAVREAYPSTFCMQDYLRVNAGGYEVHIGGRFSSKWVQVDQTERALRLVVRDYQRHNITDEKLAERIKEHAIKKTSFERVCETAYHEAMSVLNIMTSGKKLAEAWPEAIPVIGDLIPEGSRTLPVVQVSAINAKFGLPPKTKKESK